jgi:glycerol-3-phosphate acyltransferase PlsY
MQLSMHLYLIVAAIAYLLGSIPFGFILTSIFLGTDVRTLGSGNIGATNVLRTGSKGLGIATLVLDAGKGYAAVFVALWLSHVAAGDPSRPAGFLAGVAAVCAILGHVFPVWLRFKGGKGVATGVGVFMALVPQAVVLVLLIFAMVFLAFRYVSLASIVATALFPAAAVVLSGRNSFPLLPFMGAAALLIIVKHYANIRRLLNGTEHRFEFTRR